MTPEQFKEKYKDRFGDEYTIIPTGRFDMLYRIDEDKKYKVCKQPFVVDYIFKDDEGNRTMYVVGLLKKEGLVKAGFPTKHFSILTTFEGALSEKGIYTVSNQEAVEFCKYQEQELEAVEVTDILGYHADPEGLYFVTPNGECIGQAAGKQYSRSNPFYFDIMKTKGDMNKWIELIDMLNLSNERPTIPFLLAASLLPLLARIDKRYMGFFINIIPNKSGGDSSSNGKSTMLKLMLSMQTSEEWLAQWNTTINAVEPRLVENYGFIYPLAIQKIIEQHDKIDEAIDNALKVIAADIKNPMWERLAKTYARVSVMGDIFLDVLRDIKKDPHYLSDISFLNISTVMFHNRLEALSARNKPYEEALEHLKQKIRLSDNKVYDRWNNSIGIVKDGMVCIQMADVKEIISKELESNNFEDFLNWLIKEGKIAKTDRDRNDRYSITVNKVSVKTYAFSLEEFQGKSEEEGQTASLG